LFALEQQCVTDGGLGRQGRISEPAGSQLITLELELALELDPHRQSRSQKTEDRIQNYLPELDLSLVRFSKAFVPAPSAAKLRFKIAWGEAKRNPRNPPTTRPSSEGAAQTND